MKRLGLLMLAPCSSANSIKSESNSTTSMLPGMSATSRFTIASRSAVENIGSLDGFVVTPITSLSTRCAPRRMISRCPRVTGSNVPG
jgi:hypothetical protein